MNLKNDLHNNEEYININVFIILITKHGYDYACWIIISVELLAFNHHSESHLIILIINCIIKNSI